MQLEYIIVFVKIGGHGNMNALCTKSSSHLIETNDMYRNIAHALED